MPFCVFVPLSCTSYQPNSSVPFHVPCVCVRISLAVEYCTFLVHARLVLDAISHHLALISHSPSKPRFGERFANTAQCIISQVANSSAGGEGGVALRVDVGAKLTDSDEEDIRRQVVVRFVRCALRVGADGVKYNVAIRATDDTECKSAGHRTARVGTSRLPF